MIKTLRIIIGFWVSIPYIIIGLTFYFLKDCLDRYKGWLIDLKAMSELRAIKKAVENCRKRSYKASGL